MGKDHLQYASCSRWCRHSAAGLTQASGLAQLQQEGASPKDTHKAEQREGCLELSQSLPPLQCCILISRQKRTSPLGLCDLNVKCSQQVCVFGNLVSSLWLQEMAPFKK